MLYYFNNQFNNQSTIPVIKALLPGHAQAKTEFKDTATEVDLVEKEIAALYDLSQEVALSDQDQ